MCSCPPLSGCVQSSGRCSSFMRTSSSDPLAPAVVVSVFGSVGGGTGLRGVLTGVAPPLVKVHVYMPPLVKVHVSIQHPHLGHVAVAAACHRVVNCRPSSVV